MPEPVDGFKGSADQHPLFDWASFDIHRPTDIGLQIERPPVVADLKPTATIVSELNAIRGFVAGNSRGITRDDTMVVELAKILHAKIYDELHPGPNGSLRFFRARDEEPEETGRRIRELLRDARKDSPSVTATGEAWGDRDTLLLDDASIAYAVQWLQLRSIARAERDVLGEAFETLIGPRLRGAEGQFFTSRNIVQMCVEMLDPSPAELIIDPAAGTGGFLTEALRHTIRKAGPEVRSSQLASHIFGVDKDAFLASLTLDHLELIAPGNHVFCENSLAQPEDWSEETQQEIRLGKFDVVLTNPPFGAAIPVAGDALLRQYSLAHAWKRTSSSHEWVQQARLLEKQAPQVLFVERCVQLLREGGRCAIVLPEGILGNVSDGYIRTWLAQHTEILAIVDCPLETFLPSTPTKTCVLFFRKVAQPQRAYPVFLAIAEWCGHDRRGKPLYDTDGARRDDLPLIAQAYLQERDSYQERPA
jgi:type I restriction enzyme M protein